MSRLWTRIAALWRRRGGAGPGFARTLERLLRDEDPLVLRAAALEQSLRHASLVDPHGPTGMGR